MNSRLSEVILKSLQEVKCLWKLPILAERTIHWMRVKKWLEVTSIDIHDDTTCNTLETWTVELRFVALGILRSNLIPIDKFLSVMRLGSSWNAHIYSRICWYNPMDILFFFLVLKTNTILKLYTFAWQILVAFFTTVVVGTFFSWYSNANAAHKRKKNSRMWKIHGRKSISWINYLLCSMLNACC